MEPFQLQPPNKPSYKPSNLRHTSNALGSSYAQINDQSQVAHQELDMLRMQIQKISGYTEREDPPPHEVLLQHLKQDIFVLAQRFSALENQLYKWLGSGTDSMQKLPMAFDPAQKHGDCRSSSSDIKRQQTEEFLQGNEPTSNGNQARSTSRGDAVT